MSKILDYLSQYFGNDNLAKYPGLIRRSEKPQSFEFSIEQANHGVIFTRRDELDTFDWKKI